MSRRRREVQAGLDRGRRLRAELCRELDEGIRSSGLSYAAVGRAAGLSGDQVARICRGEAPDVGLVRLAVLLAIVGLELGARAYPAGDAIRDAPQVRLLARLQARVGTPLAMRLEVPVVDATVLREGGAFPDRRAWDAVIEVGGGVLAVEAETRVRDVQAMLRRVELKRRDGRVDRVLLLLNDTVHHRQLASTSGALLSQHFPGTARDCLRALRAGRLPPADTLLLL